MTEKVRSIKTESFNKTFDKLGADIKSQAVEAFDKWKQDHNSIGFKPLAITNNVVWSAQVNSRYRALAKKTKDDNGKTAYVWFWIGSHEDYNNVLKRLNNIHGNIGKVRQENHENTSHNKLKA